MQNKYEILSVIGEGSYGIVYKCRNRETNEIVAIKKFKDKTDISSNKSMFRELKSLKTINHKNIISFRESFKKKGSYFFVFDYIEKNLLEFLSEYPDGIQPNLIKHIIFQICSGIKEIHKYHLAHRDIKPENVLIDRTHKIKICDFGFTRFIEKNSNEYLTEYVATRWYRAPELLIGEKKYGTEIDYWSVGCIMGELIDGNPIFPGENDMEQIYMIYKICGKDSFSYEQIQIIEKKHHLAAAKVEKTKYINPLNNSEISMEINLDKRYSSKISRDALNFLKRLLDPNPQTRMKGDEIFDHPYLLNYYQIYLANNELYINNFDDNNSFLKNNIKNQMSVYTETNLKTSKSIIDEVNSNNTYYPSINTISHSNNTKNSITINNFYGPNQKGNSNTLKEKMKKKLNDNDYKNKLNLNTNYQYNSNTLNNPNAKNIVPIMENFFENIESNSYDEITQNINENHLGAFSVMKDSNELGLTNPLYQLKENNEDIDNENSDSPSNHKANSKFIMKYNNKNISLEKSKNEVNNPSKHSNFDFFGNENFSNMKFNNYNIETLKPPNKEERNNFSYYNNIKLYNEDLFEKTGKIKKSVNPYESIYKITSTIKKENDKKDKMDNDKASTNFNSSNQTQFSKEKENKNLNSNHLSPISEGKYYSNFKKEKYLNSNIQLSMNLNFDKNKIFLSPQKLQENSNLFFSHENNRNYTNNNFSNEKAFRSTNTNEKNILNDFKKVAFSNISNNFNKPSMENNYNNQSPNRSPDVCNSNSNLASSTKYSINVNTLSNNFPSSINNLAKSNRFNSIDFSSSKNISFNSKSINSNLNIKTNKDKNTNSSNNNNQINDFLKNIIHQNNLNMGLVTVKNSNLDHKRFNSLNTQNSFLVNGEENKKSNSLKKLQLPIIAKKEIGNKV